MLTHSLIQLLTHSFTHSQRLTITKLLDANKRDERVHEIKLIKHFALLFSNLHQAKMKD